MKRNLDDLEPMEPGCPHCGAMTTHPNSSRPVVKVKVIAVSKAKKVEPLKPAERPDGKFAYDLFIALMGHKEVAVPWDKVIPKAQEVWTGVARGLERRTIEALLVERARIEQESKR